MEKERGRSGIETEFCLFGAESGLFWAESGPFWAESKRKSTHWEPIADLARHHRGLDVCRRVKEERN